MGAVDTDAPSQVTEDVGPSDVTETSSTEDSLDTDVALEDIEINIDELQDEDETEETVETPKEEAATEPEEAETEESTEDVESEDSETEEKPEPTQPEAPEVERARLNDEAAKRRIAERQLREERQAREREKLETYLRDAGEDEVEFERRQIEVERYLLANERSETLQTRLATEVDAAFSKIDLFKSSSDAVKEELAQAVQDFETNNVIKDDQGRIVAVKGSLYDTLQNKAESIRKLTGIGAQQEARDKKVLKTKTETVPSRVPKEPKKDPYLEAFEEEAARY